jgi:hypothetical protein
MLKETGYQEKIEMLAPWLEEIIETVKRDLKNEHLKIDRQFCKKYFLGKNPSHVPLKEMAEAYRIDIAAGNVGLGEFIATRWLLKNTDIYGYFEENIRKVTSDFEQLQELPHDLASSLMQGSVNKFGAKKTYLFSVFNSVVFSPSVYAQLKEMAEMQTQEVQQELEMQATASSLEQLQNRHNREIAALTDRYEKKLSGMQKKYLNDVEGLKKQIAKLQKRIDHG